MTASIDVLIPAYNAARTIRSAVDSIRAQTVRDIAIHVVDDGSTDDTASVLAGMAQEEPRLRVHHKANGGIVDALNHGLSFCTAPLIARHDADDLAYPHRFAVQKAWLDANPDAVAVGSAARHIDADDRPLGTSARLLQPDQADLFAVPAREPYIIHPFLMVRRDAVERVGGYRHAHHAEDADLYWRLLGEGRLHNLPDVLGDYRMHAESVTSKSIVNGRVAAIGSQLAAFSARRRAAGRTDLVFARTQQRELEAAGAIAPMVEIAAAGMAADERVAFEEAVAGKLLELTGYRPYELDRGDVDFVRRVVDRGFAHLPAPARGVQVRRLTGTGARLAAGGRVADGLALVPAALLPQMAARWAIRAPVFRALRARMARRHGAPVK
ncbi:glycosyltransferase family 2 protein [Sphingomonas corticis]|jgi:GT2 family glycosyltransferase|uniref:Glycosyltransferase n=1 Tax=Sphingomonas corticis TaxID=2722791 RepID=A0ABX1CMZ4_9SPHN|nr:glycosyltransferase [Sphingomonas corticis]NJR77707.1 glycosyltransferase [Sphingomonas corticis]